jgi:Cu+-exporting ATPase
MYKRLKESGFKISMISGDVQSEKATWEKILPGAEIVMEATPGDKLNFVASQIALGDRVAMVGDGMNDAGAFEAADIGISVRDSVYNFSPSCDVILEADGLANLPALLSYARQVLIGVGWGFGLSLLFNAVALTLAISGQLSPMIAALLMPASSLSVVLFSVGLVNQANRRFNQNAISLPIAQ